MKEDQVKNVRNMNILFFGYLMVILFSSKFDQEESPDWLFAIFILGCSVSIIHQVLKQIRGSIDELHVLYRVIRQLQVRLEALEGKQTEYTPPAE